MSRTPMLQAFDAVVSIATEATAPQAAWEWLVRDLKSAALDAVKQVELAAAAAGDEALRSLLSYAGQLGAALVVSKFASRGLFGGLPRVVGFDSGDFALLEHRST